MVGLAEGIPAAAGALPGEALNVVSPPYDESAIARPGPQFKRIGAPSLDGTSPRTAALTEGGKEAALLGATAYPPLRPLAAAYFGASALGGLAGTDDPREAGQFAGELAGAGALAKHSAPRLRAFADKIRPKPKPLEVTGGGLPPTPPPPRPGPAPTTRALPGYDPRQPALPDLTEGRGVETYSAAAPSTQLPVRPALPPAERLALPPGTEQARVPSEVVFDTSTGEISRWVPGAQGQTLAPPSAPQAPPAPATVFSPAQLRGLGDAVSARPRLGPYPVEPPPSPFAERRSAAQPEPAPATPPPPYPELGGAPAYSIRQGVQRPPASRPEATRPPPPAPEPPPPARPYPPLGGAAAGSTRTRVRPADVDIIDVDWQPVSQPYRGTPEQPGRGDRMKRVFRDSAPDEFDAARERLGGMSDAGVRVPPVAPRTDKDIIEDYQHKTELKPEPYKTPGSWIGKAFERVVGGNVDRMRALYGLSQFDSNWFARIGATDLRRESAQAKPRIYRDIVRSALSADEATLDRWVELERKNPVARDIPRKERAGEPLTADEQSFRNAHREIYDRVADGGFRYLDEHRAKGIAGGDLGPQYFPGGQEAMGVMLDAERAAASRRAGEFGEKPPDPKRGSLDYQRTQATSTKGSIEALRDHIKDTVDRKTTDGELARLRVAEERLTAEGRVAEAADLREWMKKMVLELPGDDALLEKALRQRGLENVKVEPGVSFDARGRGRVEIAEKVDLSDGPAYRIQIDGQPVTGHYSKGQILSMMYPDEVAAVKPGLLSVDGMQGLMARYFLYFNPMPALKASIFNTVRLGLSNNPRYTTRGLRAARDVALGMADEATIQRYQDLGLLEGLEGMDTGNRALRAADTAGLWVQKTPDKYHRVAAFEASKSRLMEAHPEWPIDRIEAVASRIAAQQSDLAGTGLRSVRERDNWFVKTVNFFDRPQQRAWAQVAQLLRESARKKDPRPFIQAAGIIGVPAAAGAAMWDAAGADPMDGFMAFAGLPYVGAFFSDAQMSAGASQKIKGAKRLIEKTLKEKDITRADLRRVMPTGMVKVGDLFSDTPGRFFGREKKEE